MANETEPRALSAALAAPAFVTRGHGVALHAANRHVERWAPEATAGRVRSMRSLGFVDRLVAPWVETAQRSASMRVFSQYAQTGASERPGGAVSWVFPRPWYQDELDWMAAARQVAARPDTTPSLLTTRGTYVAPARSEVAAPAVAMPAALYEYVAPSLSIAGQPAAVPGVGFGGESLSRGEAYSPLISLAAVQAAELMSRTVGPLAARPAGTATTGAAGAPGASAVTPALRSVLTAILARAATPRAHELPATRLAMSAPELVTPPAPRPGDAASDVAVDPAAASATRVADDYAEQRARIVELQRIAQQSAQRELATRAEMAARAAAAAGADPRMTGDAARAAAQATERAATERAERERQQAGQVRAAELQRDAEIARLQAAERARSAETADRARIQDAAERARSADAAERARTQDAAERARTAEAADRARSADAAERARLEERIAQRVAERTAAQRLHEQARAEAAAHARMAIEPVPGAGAIPGAPSAAPAGASADARVSAEVSSAVAGLPAPLAAIVGPAVARRPDRALQVIGELNETLRTVELLARSSAAGAAFEPTRGPRLMMPAGLGGLVSAVDRAQSISERPAMLGGARPLAPIARFVEPPAVEPRPELVAGAATGSAAALSLGFVRPAGAWRDARVPTLPWLSAAARPQPAAPTTALAATATATPAALSHVAWTDRWLARFAGAAPQSLDLITAAAARAPGARFAALANAAPDAVFVAPELLRGDGALAGRADEASLRAATAPASGASAQIAAAAAAAAAATAAERAPSELAGMRLINPPSREPIRRFDDTEETPDDVFAAIAAAASRARPSRPGATSGAAAAGTIAAGSAVPSPSIGGAAGRAEALAGIALRPTMADVVAHAAPSAPGAGLSAQLASSPFAPALRHLLTLPSAASFDVRSLFGAGLGATYLAGLVGAGSRELEIGAQLAPTWASWSEAPLGLPADRIDRVVPEFEPAYVSPDAAALDEAGELAAEIAAASAAREALAAGAAVPSSAAFDAESAALPAMAATQRAGAPGDAASIPLTTLRSALLSWDLVATGAAGETLAAGSGADVRGPVQLQTHGLQLVPASFATPPAAGEAQSASAARMMIEAMSLPLLGDAAPDPTADWAAPGMIAGRAQAWAVAQERSSSDLALDFVPPELVLAARVYGLGPAEAAQAARLAIVGPGQLGAMASTVDRTFVEALAIGREARSQSARRERFAAEPAVITTAFPTAQGDVAAIAAGAAATEPVATGAAGGPGAPGALDLGAQLPSGTAFGVDRRVPRGAFLWPSATIAALGMSAATPDGQLSTSIAALELLAAQAVAELGTYTVLSEAAAAARGHAGEIAPEAADALAADRAASLDAGGAAVADRELADRAAAGRASLVGPAGVPAARADAARAEPGEADVLGAAAALVPASRRARFEALYVALSQSTTGREWSPAARAARALALAGRGEDGAMTARERAATAWEVLPVVYASDAGAAGVATAGPAAEPGAAASAAAELLSSYVAPSGGGDAGAGPGAAGREARTGGAAGSGRRAGARGEHAAPLAAGGDLELTHVSPGLGRLSARAGEALDSYVTPVAPPAAPRERPADVTSAGAVLRPPTAAPEYVQTGRASGRYGGGEVEIPPWFEAAARKMLAERSDNADGISLAELTLVTAAPATHIAAAAKAPPSAVPTSAAGAGQASANLPKIDVEKLANELYRDIMILMDVARARNGEPYL